MKWPFRRKQAVPEANRARESDIPRANPADPDDLMPDFDFFFSKYEPKEIPNIDDRLEEFLARTPPFKAISYDSMTNIMMKMFLSKEPFDKESVMLLAICAYEAHEATFGSETQEAKQYWETCRDLLLGIMYTVDYPETP